MFRHSMSFNQVNKAAELSAKRVITNFNLKDFEKAFVKKPSATYTDAKTRKKAQALLEIASNDVKNARKFFKSEAACLEPIAISSSAFKKRLSGNEKPSVNFYEFYEIAIRGRVLRKLEEEASSGNVKTTEGITELSGTEDEYPKTITTVETDSEGEAEEKPVVKRPPRRRPATTNFSFLG